jgi:hypothetical protein
VKLSGRAWAAIAVLAAVGGAVWLGVYEHARIAAASPAGMLQRLPPQDATVLFADFDTLRRGGLLKLLASKTPEEPDYQTFVRATGFDYRTDLDMVAASFSNNGEYFVVKGRFDWKKLRAYAEAQGGSCQRNICRMPGSTPERRISFLPLQSNLMALAVSTDSFAASRLVEGTAGIVQPLDPPRDPVWLSISAESLKTANQLPAGSRFFAAALASADKILLSLGPQGEQLEARLAVTCRTSADAIALAAQLQHATVLVRNLIAQENQKPDPKDLSGVLTAGVFEQSGRRVIGRWPLPSVFLESLAGGTL